MYEKTHSKYYERMVKMDWIIFEKLMVILFECMFLTLSDRSIKVTDNTKRPLR